MSFADIKFFRPTKLDQALRIVQSHHRDLNSEVPDNFNSILKELKKLLSETDSDDLDSVARTLSVIKLRCCLQLICLEKNKDQDVSHKAAVVVDHRLRKDLLRPSWDLLIQYYPVPELEEITKALGHRFGWQSIAGEEQSTKISGWFESPSLSQGIADNFSRSSSSSPSDWLKKNGFDQKMGIYRHVLGELLVNFSKDVINRVGHVYFMWMAQQMFEVHQKAFSTRYLNLLKEKPNWQIEILQWIESKYGKPAIEESGLSPFWKDINEDARRKFRVKLIEKTLEEFFRDIHDPYNRFPFWKQFLDHIVDAKRPPDAEVVLLHFGHFGAVEFAQVGNAAYLYPRDAFQHMWLKADRNYLRPDMLKDRESTIKNYRSYWDGRILHREGWEDRYFDIIANLIRSR